MARPSSDTLSRLQKAIDLIPLIDNHAHNVFQTYDPSEKYPRESLVSEATGGALNDSIHSLPHLRMRKQLARARSRNYETFCRDLIKVAGIQIILFDDGIVNEFCHPISWHDRLTPYPNKRVVRIETLFESIVAAVGPQAAFDDFIHAIKGFVDDQEVVGFKSIAAYRSGLDVQPSNMETGSATSNAPIQFVEQSMEQATDSIPPFRVEHPVVVKWLLNTTLSIISGRGKPIQFHTGLGDNDIDLIKSDASHLQPLIKAYPNVPFVLLHSGYPYARQAGYLATVYSNVYLDFGLAIPLLSEVVNATCIPSGTILLGSPTIATGPAEVLAEYTDRQEIQFEEALEIAKRLFFENSNKLYKLGVKYTELDHATPSDSATPPEHTATTEVEKLTRIPNNLDLKGSISFIKSQGIKFIRLTWVDYVNMIRYRVIPNCSLRRIAESGPGVVRVGLSLGVQDSMPAGGVVSGDVELKADYSSMWKAPFAPGHAYMMGRFFEKEHSQRSWGIGHLSSHNLAQDNSMAGFRRAERELDARFLVGFETEFILLDHSNSPIRTGPWSSSQKLQCGPAADCVHEIAQCIIDAGIKLEMYHAESARGQYEVVTGPLPPLQAADALVSTREIIYNVARKYGYRATLSPRLYSNQSGTACHAHISVQSPRSNTPSNHPDIPSLPSDLASLMAGLLENLVSVCAFTLPVDACYSRVMDGVWSGGSWVCWGRENKEAPLRLCGSGKGFNIEIKSFDGTANPYLGLAAVLGAGVAGLSAKKRNDMHITARMPTQSPVLEPGLGLNMDFIRTWLPESAWEVFKSVREDERNNLKSLKQNKEHSDLSWKELSAIVCQEHY
ncbi:glutamine synthetase [Rhizoctonia solani]|uniref:Glutamine synthetase n=1 Tax=Rhizoctonia solani TaxID=456999 RepID=A0A8H8P1C4_9AGAM|nr:glutamine synthetase [Rhizoctonia solani]QRW23425.1 glutamine synthetase [Rhizoctonia solani]